jgi:hypothetical protein
MRRIPWVGLWLSTNALLALAACGSRSGLDDDAPLLFPDATDDERAAPDATRDAPEMPDGAPPSVDVAPPRPDALPPLDVTPQPDAPVPNGCQDAGPPVLYLMSSTHDLYGFYPPTLTLRKIAFVPCPGHPYSMAVDHAGRAFVVYTDGALYEVSTVTGECYRTAHSPGESGFEGFGMGFATSDADAGESLFVAGGTGGIGGSIGLGTIDTQSPTYPLTAIGPFSTVVQRAELTGTGGGRLFGFSLSQRGSSIIEIDKATGNILGSDPVAAGAFYDAFAFAFWAGEFWIFTGATVTQVYRYRPSDKTTTLMTTFPPTAVVVGAGVSTCAPQ